MKKLFTLGLFFLTLNLFSQKGTNDYQSTEIGITASDDTSKCSETTKTAKECYKCCKNKKNKAMEALDKWRAIKNGECFIDHCDDFHFTYNCWVYCATEEEKLACQDCKAEVYVVYLEKKATIDSAYHACVDGCLDDAIGNGVFKTIEEARSDFVNINIYPNPAHHLVNIEMDMEYTGTLLITITNLYGQNVKSFTVDKKEGYYNHTVQVSDMSSGIYFLIVQGSDFVEKQRIIIAR